MLKYCVLVACTAIRVNAGQTALTAECRFDWVMHGAQVQANPVLSLRSGEPKQVTSAAVARTLTEGSEITSLEFSYQYLTGYSPTGKSSNFTLKVAGKTVYASPELSNYTYDQNRSGYSPPVEVKLAGLAIKVPSGTASRIEVDFNNNDRNVQLKLPLEFNVGCTGAACAASPLWEPSERHVVFKGGEKDETGTVCPAFRIPSLAVAPGNIALLAFAEGRYAGYRPDVSVHTRIVMKRSLDGLVGKEWGPVRVIAGNDFTPSTGMNYPAPVVDNEKGIVHLFFQAWGAGSFRISSADGGLTWGKKLNMSANAGFPLGVAGGGGGVQLASGRLVFACGSPLRACWTDDHGATWKHGGNVTEGPGVTGLGEAGLVADGRGANTLSMTIRCGSR
jgi:hypothetical protein